MKNKHIAVATILSLAAASALAGNWYVVGSVGQSEVQDTNKGEIDAALASIPVTGLSSSMDDTDTGYKLQLGYKFTPNWAIEGGYVDLGKFKYDATFAGGTANAEIKVTGWNIAAVGTYPINEQFSVFGKLGVIDAKVEADFTATGPGGTASDGDSSTKAKGNWGVGATYNINKQWGVRAEWERFDKLGDKDKTGESDVDLLSVGVVFNF